MESLAIHTHSSRNWKGQVWSFHDILVRVLLAALCAAALSSSNLTAAPVLWTLTGVSFDDGGMASGSFRFDSTGTYSGNFSDINITTFGGSIGGATYNALASLGCANGPTILCVVPVSGADLTGSPVLQLNLIPTLSDPAGSVSLSGNEGICTSPLCRSSNPERYIGGAVTAAATPEASSLTLIAMGALALLTGTLRRRFAATNRPKLLGMAADLQC